MKIVAYQGKEEKEKMKAQKKEEKEKEDKEEIEGCFTFAALMEERILGRMPNDDVDIAPQAPPPLLSAYRQSDLAPVPGVSLTAPRCHSSIFQHHDSPLRTVSLFRHFSCSVDPGFASFCAWWLDRSCVLCRKQGQNDNVSPTDQCCVDCNLGLRTPLVFKNFFMSCSTSQPF